MARDVSTLDVPRSRAGARAAARAAAAADTAPNNHGTTNRGRQVAYGAYVLTDQDATEGRLRVAIDGEAKTAYLAPTCKAVHVGDIVTVQKLRGAWYVIENHSWHTPPSAPAPSTTTPGSAQTPSTVSLRTVDDNLTGATSTSTSILQAWTYTCASDVREHGDAINRLNSQVASLRSAVNNNATRQNQVRDVATSTRDSVSGLRDGAIQDRIVR